MVVYANLDSATLVEHALNNNEGKLTNTGAFRAVTGERTGRSPKDRYIVKDSVSTDTVDWGNVNRPIEESIFNALWERVENYLVERSHYVSLFQVGAAVRYAIPVEVKIETAWHTLFARNMFITGEHIDEINNPKWQILHAANFCCEPARDKTNSDAVVMISFSQRKVLIAGMKYAGEMKKAMFSVQNYLLPERDVMPMHCAANVGKEGDTCLFFGLSGTGKTTLSADVDRYLIGDDEHGWGEDVVFNFEGGCYAKTINLSQENEPVIWDAIKHGAIVENVILDDGGHADYDDVTFSENGRCSYPLTHVGKRCIANMAGEPKNIIFLTCDVTSVLPPVSILSKESAAYHFLSGYTAKIGSTEVGGEKGIAPTFSSCFGAPFMPKSAQCYADLLMKRIGNFNSNVYLVNTGWTGGSGAQGKRFPIPVTRAIIKAIQRGDLVDCATEHVNIINLNVPLEVSNVDKQYLNPRNAWKNSKEYDESARELAKLFEKNISNFSVGQSIIEAGLKSS